MEEFLKEFLKIRTWIFGVLYWFFVFWETHRAGVKIKGGGLVLFGIVFVILLVTTLGHPVTGSLLTIGFALLAHEILKDPKKH